jgi:transcription initiation factor TFIIIB Brf1 subunit/transcription initiation factor TFIIB
LRPFDNDLLSQSRKLNLPEDVVIGAKKIILHLETEQLLPKALKPYLTAIIRAALLAACRQLGIPKTFNELEGDLDARLKSTFHKQFKTIDWMLKRMVLTPPVKTSSDGSRQSSASPSPASSFPASFTIIDFIHSEAKAMNLSDIIRDRAIAIAQYPEIDQLFHGRRPSSTAAIILSFAAECEEYYIGTEPYAEVANVSANNILTGQRRMLKVVEDMAAKGPLPKPFRARWNFLNYRPHLDD